MERLTKKLSDGNFTCECGLNYFEYGDGHLEIFNKLGKLEDIEQELGITLEVLFKALKEGIWYEHKYYGVQFCNFVNLLDGGYWRLSIVNPKDDFEHDLDLGLEEYGVTWALSKEELE